MGSDHDSGTCAHTGNAPPTGFTAGKLVSLIGLPKVTGYIVAGVFLNPQVSGLVPDSFIDHSNLTSNLTLAIITFSAGASLYLLH